MDILSYLLELLQQRREVGITGLGTFYKKKFPGRYDKEKQAFLPPGYVLQFSREVKDEQAILEFISAKRNISTESTAYYITQFVEEVNKKLELEHEANLDDLGRLFYTEHEGLSFEPAQNINYGSEFYGLPTLQESAPTLDEVKTDIQKTADEEVHEEIAEAPTFNLQSEKAEDKEYKHPIIENVELDEVSDDLKNTLKHSDQFTETEMVHPEFTEEQEGESTDTTKQASEIEEATNQEALLTPHEIETPTFIKEQHEEHPNRFGHKPESEQEAIEAETITPIVEAPDFIRKQSEDNPNRFKLTTELETPRTYIDLQEELPKEEIITEAPEFIKEQHAEHPNRFGHDPTDHDDTTQQGMSAWLKVTIVVLVLIIIAIITYLVKPDLFERSAVIEQKPVPVAKTNKIAEDSLKTKQDSIAKTDSILKANQVSAIKTIRTDTAKKVKSTPIAPVVPIQNTGTVTFEVIGTSVETTKRAEQFVKSMKKFGIEARIIKGLPGKLIKVSVGSFKTESEARKQRPILEEKIKIKGLYIQQTNNTP